MTEYQRHTRSLTRLWVVTLLGCVYAAIFVLRPLWLGQPLLAGSIGVLLGLYICSHPAANGIDVLFLSRGHYVDRSTTSDMVWLLVNVLVLLVGLVVIIIGATRFSVPAG
jgi:hypothetical protein